MTEINLLDIVALTVDLPQRRLSVGEIGTVVAIHPTDGFEVEFVAQDGYTYALVSLSREQLLPLKQKPARLSASLVAASFT